MATKKAAKKAPQKATKKAAKKAPKKASSKGLETIDDYIARAPAPVRPMLEAIRKAVTSAVPDAEERISYRMPSLKRNKRVFLYFAAFKAHIGMYPPVKGDAKLEKDLLPYHGGPKGNLKFPFDERLPLPLIRRVAKALAEQYAPAIPTKRKK